MPGERSGSVLADWDAGDRPAPGPPDADKYSSRAFGGIPSPRQRVCVAEVRSISIASIQVLKYQASFSKPGPRALGSSPLVVCGLPAEDAARPGFRGGWAKPVRTQTLLRRLLFGHAEKASFTGGGVSMH